jgi:hypothetical protein
MLNITVLRYRRVVDEIILLVKIRVIFKQFGMKLYKLCDSKLYNNNMTVCAIKDKKRATITELTARIENVRYKLYTDNFFLSS